jgi:hypothetical protein
MADGLLSGLTNWIDQRKQAAKASVGLLADNPQEWAAQATARYFPTKEEERQFRMVKQMGGDITQTPYYQKVFDLTQFQGSIKPKSLLNAGGLPSPQSLAMPDVPTVEQMKQYGRVETVPLSKAVSFQSARNWEKFNAGKSPGDLVAGYGDKPLALRLETGEYVIYDGNHRTDLALQKGKTEMPMHVIDVKSYDPAHAGRKPVPDKMSTDELLKMLLGN